MIYKADRNSPSRGQPMFPEVIPLQTREFSCFFEPSTGFFAACRIVRGRSDPAIYAAVRDKNWDTVEAELEIERLEREEGFLPSLVHRPSRCGAGFIFLERHN